MLRFFALVFLALLVVPLVGCANIVRGTYQQIHIGAYDTLLGVTDPGMCLLA